MLDIQEFNLETCPDCPPPFSNRLRSLGRSLSRLPAFRRLVQQIKLVAEPAGTISLRKAPVRIQRMPHQSLTVLSANLWHDWPRFRRLAERLEDFARLAENARADLLLLQEVANLPSLHAGVWLAERLGFSFVYSRSNGHRQAIGFEEGLAILSRYPLGSPVLYQLSRGSNPFWRRMALGVPVHAPGGDLMAFSIHLGISGKQNTEQIARLQSWVTWLTGDRPALVGGDFNAHETSRQIQNARRTWRDTFRQLHPQAEGTTHLLRWPWGGTLLRQRLDYIFLHPGHTDWAVLETRHLDSPGGPHSDHRAVLTRLQLF